MPYVIDLIEYRQLLHHGIVASRIMDYWQECLSRLPDNLKEEAKTKSFQLISHPHLEVANTRYSQNLAFHIPTASEELQKELLRPEHTIICLNDY